MFGEVMYTRSISYPVCILWLELRNNDDEPVSQRCQQVLIISRQLWDSCDISYIIAVLVYSILIVSPVVSRKAWGVENPHRFIK